MWAHKRLAVGEEVLPGLVAVTGSVGVEVQEASTRLRQIGVRCDLLALHLLSCIVSQRALARIPSAIVENVLAHVYVVVAGGDSAP